MAAFIRNVIFTIWVSLVAVSLAAAQEQPSRAVTPDELERFGKKFEKYERAVKISLRGKEQYRIGEDLSFDVMMTNTNSEALGVYLLYNHFLQEHPELKRDGKPVSFRKDKDVTFEGKPDELRARVIGLAPEKPQRFRTINLKDWFGELEPGTHEVTVGHRFWLKGKLVKSDPIIFEIG